MQLAYIDGGDCYGPDAVGILAFAGPKPDDVVKYYLGVVRAQQGLLCPRRDWLIVGIAYDTTDSKLRTSWVARTTASNADCSDSTKLLNAEQVNFSLPR